MAAFEAGYRGLLVGAVVGFFVGNVDYKKYLAAKVFAAARRQFPLNPWRFLDDAHRMGLLRTIGPAYQFRRSAQQDFLHNRKHGADSQAAAHDGAQAAEVEPAAEVKQRSALTAAGRTAILVAVYIAGASAIGISQAVLLGPTLTTRSDKLPVLPSDWAKPAQLPTPDPNFGRKGPNAPNSFKDGAYTIGWDIRAGVYRTTNAGEDCAGSGSEMPSSSKNIHPPRPLSHLARSRVFRHRHGLRNSFR